MNEKINETCFSFANIICDSDNERTYLAETLRKKIPLAMIRKNKTMMQCFRQPNSLIMF